MKEIRERLRQAMGSMRPADLSRLTGVGESNISRYLKDREWSIEFLTSVCRVLEVNANWLLFGDGPMKLGTVDLSLMSFQAITAELLSRLGQMRSELDVVTSNYVAQVKPPGPQIQIVDPEELPQRWVGRYVPIIGRLAAGKGVDTVEAESYPVGLASRFLRYEYAGSKMFACEIDGDSMQPDFQHGDIVIVDGAAPVTSGICAVIQTINGERIARVKKLVLKKDVAELRSLNKEHKTITVPADKIEAFAIVKHLPIR